MASHPHGGHSGREHPRIKGSYSKHCKAQHTNCTSAEGVNALAHPSWETAFPLLNWDCCFLFHWRLLLAKANAGSMLGIVVPSFASTAATWQGRTWFGVYTVQGSAMDKRSKDSVQQSLAASSCTCLRRTEATSSSIADSQASAVNPRPPSAVIVMQ